MAGSLIYPSVGVGGGRKGQAPCDSWAISGISDAVKSFRSLDSVHPR